MLSPPSCCSRSTLSPDSQPGTAPGVSNSKPAAGSIRSVAAMASVDAALHMASSSQDDLIARREHCSVDPQMLDTLGVAVGQQVRIQRTPTELALFTISERRDEVETLVVRAGLVGRRRLGTDDEVAVTLSTP